MGLKCSKKYPYERNAEGDYGQKRRRQCDQRGRDWSNVATSQGMLTATSSRKNQGTDFPLETS